MTRTTRALRPATPAAVPMSIEAQDAQARDALARAQALEADALHALDAAFAAYVASPNGDTARAYSTAHAHHVGLTDLVREAKAWAAEVAEALQRHRAAEADAPRRAAEAEKQAELNARAARIWNDPRNAERAFREAVSAEAARLPFGTMTGNIRLTPEMIEAGLSRNVRKGKEGEPGFVALDPEAWADFLRWHVRLFFDHPEIVLGLIRTMLGAPLHDNPTRLAVSAAAANGPSVASPTFGGIRR